MSSDLLDGIRNANREFQEFIERVSQNGAKVVESRGAERRLVNVNRRLEHVSKLLAAYGPSSWKEPDVAYEILKYQETLKALRNVMGTLQYSLLAEKARLENVRSNMRAASAWATSVREIY